MAAAKSSRPHSGITCVLVVLRYPSINPAMKIRNNAPVSSFAAVFPCSRSTSCLR